MTATLSEPRAQGSGSYGVHAAKVALSRLTLEPPAGCRVGVDVMRVQDVADSVDRFGDRYLDRLFTAHELECCTGTPEVVAAGLAARLAAKEAAIKVMRPAGPQPDWRSIEIVRRPSRACDLLCHGRAAELMRAAGLHSPTVSLSHEGGVAVAVVMALISTSSADERAGHR